MMNLKNMDANTVDTIMKKAGYVLNFTTEKKGGLYEAVYTKVSAGVTVKEVYILFGRNKKVGLTKEC